MTLTMDDTRMTATEALAQIIALRDDYNAALARRENGVSAGIKFHEAVFSLLYEKTIDDFAPDGVARSQDATERPPRVIPDHLKAEVDVILGPYRGISLVIADQLIEAGLDTMVAGNVVVGTMLTEATRTGALLAHAFEKREPRRDWWLISAAEHFDEAVKWYAEMMAKAAEEVAP